MSFVKVDYASLNARQQELYNFQKMAARLADYGYNCIWLTDDWQGADFLACHADGQTILRVQLKGRLVLDRKYEGKGIHVAFRDGEDFFIYPHDELLNAVYRLGVIGEDAVRWNEQGSRSWHALPTWARQFLSDYRI